MARIYSVDRDVFIEIRTHVPYGVPVVSRRPGTTGDDHVAIPSRGVVVEPENATSRGVFLVTPRKRWRHLKVSRHDLLELGRQSGGLLEEAPAPLATPRQEGTLGS